MRLTFERKLSLAVLGVISLSVFDSAVAITSSHQLGGLLRQATDKNLPSVRAARELEISVLEQRGFVSSYVLDDGNAEWLEGLREREKGFRRELDTAYRTANTAEERRILRELEAVYLQYDAARNEVVSLFKSGEVEKATKMLVNEVTFYQERAYELCENLIAANEWYVEDALVDARRQVTWVWIGVGFSAMATIGLGVALFSLYFYGVVFPIRNMLSEAQGLVADAPPSRRNLPSDELSAVGLYLRNLMSDVKDSRSALERSQCQLRDAEKLASVGKLAASVAHEIRNPLTSIKMWLFSLQKEVGGKESLERKFDILSEEIRRLENIVRNFLDFSRPPKLKLAVESISTLLDGTLELVEPRISQRKVTLVRQDAPNLPGVVADRAQLGQVFQNLLANAVEASSEGDEIRVVTTAESGRDGRPLVVVRLSDRGQGIPSEALGRIFEPFFTTKPEGTGLGLAIAASIMASHDGRLVLESSNDRGTTFAVFLPAALGKEK